MKKVFKSGFTLAETLITLGIIGIVAAMTIPNLITAHQKRVTVTKLQQAISDINQAYKMSYENVGEASAEEAKDLGAQKYFETYWQPYIKVLTYCSSYQVCDYKENMPFKGPNGVKVQYSLVVGNGRATFYTMNGFLFEIFTAQGAGLHDGGSNEVYSASYVLVDINGSRKPNVFGKDVFMLDRIPNGGGVQPLGYRATNEALDKNCSKAGNGFYCAEKIKRAGWKIDKSYPWK